MKARYPFDVALVDLPMRYRDAVTDEGRGPLTWYHAKDHATPSDVAELWWYCTYVHRATLCSSLHTLPMDAVSEDLRPLLNALPSVQPSLMRLRSLETKLGIRFDRAPLLDELRGGTLRDAVLACYSRSLLYVYLDLQVRTRDWSPPPRAWSPQWFRGAR